MLKIFVKVLIELPLILTIAVEAVYNDAKKAAVDIAIELSSAIDDAFGDVGKSLMH